MWVVVPRVSMMTSSLSRPQDVYAAITLGLEMAIPFLVLLLFYGVAVAQLKIAPASHFLGSLAY